MTTTFRASAFDQSQLGPFVIPPDNPDLPGRSLSGPVTTYMKTLYVSEDSRVMASVWESGPAQYYWDFSGHSEVITCIEGSMVIEREGETPMTVTEGMTAVFPLGWRGTWTVAEKFRKNAVTIIAASANSDAQ